MQRKQKSLQARDGILELIANSQTGMPLPNRNRLSSMLGVSRVTLERAISELVGEGYLDSRTGSGTYILRTGQAALGARTVSGDRRYPGAELPSGAEFSLGEDVRASESGIGRRTWTLDESTWALVISSVTHFSYPQIIRGCEDFCNDNGVKLVVCNSDNRIDKQDDYIRKLTACTDTHPPAVSGIIMIPCGAQYTNWRLFEQMEAAGISMVTCNRQVPGFDFPGVFVNFFQSGFLATNHLVDMGCRRIAFIAPPHYQTVVQRYNGFLTALDYRDVKGDIREFYLRERQYEMTDKSVCDIEQYLREHADTDGIFAFNDSVAVNVYAALKRIDKLPGRDIKVCSCDNTDIAGALHVPLTSLAFPNYEIGRNAAALMKRLRAGEPPESMPRITLRPQLVARESTLTPRGGTSTFSAYNAE